MFRKFTLSNLEYKLLLFTTLAIPMYALLWSLKVILTIIDEYLSPRPAFSFDQTAPSFAFFYLLAVVSLFISSFFIFFKRIAIPIGLYLLSIIYVIFWSFYHYERLEQRVKLNIESGFNDLPNMSVTEQFLDYFNLTDVLFIGFILFLFLWHIKIVVQDIYRNRIFVL